MRIATIVRALQQLAATDHAFAVAHGRTAIDCRYAHRTRRARRIEGLCARREADAAELRDLADTALPRINPPRDPRQDG